MGTRSDWSPRGARIRDTELRERLQAAVEAATALLSTAVGGGTGGDPGPRAAEDIDGALALLDDLSGRLRAGGAGDAETALARVALRDVHGDLREHRAQLRLGSVVGIQKGLAQLRGFRSAHDLLQATPRVVGEALGFDRVILSQVEDSMWRPVKIYVRGDEAWAEAILAASAEPESLDHLLVESSMARRRAPLLVSAVEMGDQFHRRIVQASDSRSYVAAPIMPEGAVIGFVHADQYLSQRHVDEHDRDLLFAFVEAFGFVYERTVLAERLARQADQVRAMTASLEVVLADAHEAELRIATEAPGAAGTVTAPVVPRPRAPAAPADSRLASLLTARELEVARLLAVGATNAQIAARLVVAEGTVKSHVKHILRKLHAANRAEAVSKYLRLAALPGHVDR